MTLHSLINNVREYGYGSYSLSGGRTSLYNSEITSVETYSMLVDQAIRKHIQTYGIELDQDGSFFTVIKTGDDIVILNRRYR
jgi:hypothetical protein